MEEISVREFGRRVGVSDTSIRKALEKGRIKEGYDLKKRIIHYEIALLEWNASGGGAKKFEAAVQTTSSDQQTNINQNNIIPEIETVNIRMPITEAKRLDAVFAAKKKELEVAELKRILVSREKVFKQLFQAGQEVRATLQTIPDKYIDNILASENRNEAHTILYNAITEALESLSFKNVKV